MISKGLFLIFVSMIIFGLLNIIENLIHWNIGANSNSNYSEQLKFKLPDKNDFIKILFVMVIFALVQGIATELIVMD